MTKTSRYKGLVLGSFLVPEIAMIFGDGVGASLVPLFFSRFSVYIHMYIYIYNIIYICCLYSGLFSLILRLTSMITFFSLFFLLPDFAYVMFFFVHISLIFFISSFSLLSFLYSRGCPA